jgi:hypothetical protein
METKNDEFLRAIANAECFSDAIADLMAVAYDNHFEFTVDGAIERSIMEGSSESGAYWWMQDHYDSISASTNAARRLAEALSKSLDELYMTTLKRLKEKNANEAA